MAATQWGKGNFLNKKQNKKTKRFVGRGHGKMGPGQTTDQCPV